MKTIASLVFLFVLSSGAVAQEGHSHAASKPVTVDFKNAQGQSIGTAVLSEAPHGVRIKLDIRNLPPGEHSLHIHQFAKCTAPDFKSAGSHFNPSGAAHGDRGAVPAGDIPDFSLIVAADGTAHASVVAPSVTLGSDDHSVFSNGGTSIIIHAIHAVAGGASSSAPLRIACGTITKPE